MTSNALGLGHEKALVDRSCYALPRESDASERLRETYTKIPRVDLERLVKRGGDARELGDYERSLCLALANDVLHPAPVSTVQKTVRTHAVVFMPSRIEVTSATSATVSSAKYSCRFQHRSLVGEGYSRRARSSDGSDAQAGIRGSRTWH